jgi:hypothetical protein
MHARTILVAALALAGVTVATALAARQAHWRPVMPEFVIDLRSSAGSEKPKQLLLTYYEAGSDPFRSGRPFATDRRFSGCDVTGALCIAGPARHEFRTESPRRQSLQIRKLTGTGNPIIGGLIRTGPSYPKRVKVVCDLGTADPRQACAIEDIVV